MKPIYKASDDSEHKTAAACAKHENVLEAAKAFEESRARYERAVGESILTADGQHFDMHKFRSYWRVQRWYGSAPREVEVSIYPHGLHIDSDNGKPSVRWHDARGWITFPVAELYAEKANAQKACLAMLKEDLAALTELVRVAVEAKAVKP